MQTRTTQRHACTANTEISLSFVWCHCRSLGEIGYKHATNSHLRLSFSFYDQEGRASFWSASLFDHCLKFDYWREDNPVLWLSTFKTHLILKHNVEICILSSLDHRIDSHGTANGCQLKELGWFLEITCGVTMITSHTYIGRLLFSFNCYKCIIFVGYMTVVTPFSFRNQLLLFLKTPTIIFYE